MSRAGFAMKSLTIHGIDDALDRQLRNRASRQGTSLNKTVRNLLGESLGTLRRPRLPDHADDFACFLGTWSKADVARQEDALAYSRHVNPEDWA
jgi:plasmid stability protein